MNTHLYQIHIYTTTPTFKTIQLTNMEAISKQKLITTIQSLLKQIKTQYPNNTIHYTVEAY